MRQRNKAQLFDYARILEQADYPPSLHCLSATTKMLLLSVLDPIGWTKRYIGNADKVTVEEWKDAAMVELILGQCGDELCDLVATAIQECSGVQQALQDFAALQGWSATTGNPSSMLPIGVREDNLLPDSYECDADHRYGMALGLVEYIHSTTIEVFEKIEVITNPGELAAEVADNVPFWEIAASGADIALWIQNTMYEEYNSAWSDAVKDEISCELWCAMVVTGSCHLSLDTVFNVYLDPAFPNPPSVTDSAVTWLIWLFELALTENTLIVKVASLMGLLAIRFGGAFGEMVLGLRTFGTTVTLLADDVNPDWETLCDECPDTPPCTISVGFEIGQTPPVIITQGVISTAQPHTGLNSLEAEPYTSPSGYPGRRAKFQVSMDCELNAVSFWVHMEHGHANGVMVCEVVVYDSNDQELGVFADAFFGAKNEWRTHSLTIGGQGGAYATVRFDFSTSYPGDQHMYLDDVNLS